MRPARALVPASVVALLLVTAAGGQVAAAWDRLSQDERRNAAVFAGNYGEAGAIETYGAPGHHCHQRTQRVLAVGPGRPDGRRADRLEHAARAPDD